MMFDAQMGTQIEILHGDVELHRPGHNHWVFVNDRWCQLSTSLEAVDELIDRLGGRERRG